jgi:5-hydroxyisourate hydrolase
VAVVLERQDKEGQWQPAGRGLTDGDGRVSDLSTPSTLAPGEYRLTFDTGRYFAGKGEPVFYPRVVVIFVVASASEHYHIPLLLSPFGYTTYRGS